MKAAINLLPQQDDLRRKPMAKFLKWSLTWGRIIIIVTSGILILLFIIRITLQVTEENLTKKINAYVSELQEAQSKETAIRSVQNRLAVINTIDSERLDYSTFYAKLNSIKPSGIIINDITVNGEKIDIQAGANSETDFGDFIKELKTSSSFSNIQIGSANKMMKKEDNKQNIVFQLSASINKSAFTKSSMETNQ